MTLIEGSVEDVGMTPMSGVLTVRTARFRPSGEVLYAPEAIPFPIVNGQVTAELAPGPAVLTVKVGSHAQDRFEVVIPDQVSITLADLIETVFSWEPEQINKFITERKASEAAATAAGLSAAAAMAAKDRAILEHEHVHLDAAHVDAVAAQLPALLEQANVFAQDQVPPYLQTAALNATYDPRGEALSLAGQADYVAQVERLLAPRALTITKVNSAMEMRIRSASAGGQSTTLRLMPHNTGGATDNYQYIGDVSAATGEVTAAPGERASVQAGAVTYGGSWSLGAATGYTTSVGATMEWQTTVVAGDMIRMSTFVDNRGGIFQVEIVGTAAAKTVSTWSASGTSQVVDLFTAPASGPMTIRATFQGADPANAPTGGTARGWGQATALQSSPYQFQVWGVGGVAPETTLIVSSNKDFALKVGPPGGTPQFIPYHGVDTEERIDPPKFAVDGQVVNIAGAAANTQWTGQTFDITQHFYGLNPTATTTGKRVVEVWSRQRVHASGKVSVHVRWKALTDLVAPEPNVFGLMLPVNGALFDQIVAADGRAWPHTLGSTATVTDWVPGGDRVQSWAIISSAHPDFVAAMTINAPRDSLRMGRDRKDGNHTHVAHRADGLLKVYPALFAGGATIAAGETFHVSGELLYAALPGVRNLLAR